MPPGRLVCPAFLKLFDETKFQATFYCVAADLVSESARKGIRDIVAAGHRIGNHTLDHRYALTRLDEDEMYRQVYEGKQRLEQEAQETVEGFRAPGYHVNGSVLRAGSHRSYLRQLGFHLRRITLQKWASSVSCLCGG